LQGRFEGSAASLFVRGLFMWFIVAGPLIASLIAIGAALDIAALQQLAENRSEEAFTRFIESHPDLSSAFGIAVGALTWAILVGMLLYPVFQAMLFRWWTSGLRFGEMAASSALRTGEVYACYLRYIGWSIVFSTIGTFAMLILIAAIASLLWGTGLLQNQWLAGARGMVMANPGGALYVCVVPCYCRVLQGKRRLGPVSGVANSAGLSNPATLESISSVGAPASAVGEGLADALNVGGF